SVPDQFWAFNCPCLIKEISIGCPRLSNIQSGLNYKHILLMVYSNFWGYVKALGTFTRVNASYFEMPTGYEIHTISIFAY
ncbi:hypothetical protein, partial [Moorena sp. SIO4E2]|uniref:hypothetical protein n=1 Tax=Moorena sp. SIO4E2 TaxID=2607826 RepID=UPI00257EAB11